VLKNKTEEKKDTPSNKGVIFLTFLQKPRCFEREEDRSPVAFKDFRDFFRFWLLFRDCCVIMVKQYAGL
jgi:hypothetical protein